MALITQATTPSQQQGAREHAVEALAHASVVLDSAQLRFNWGTLLLDLCELTGAADYATAAAVQFQMAVRFAPHYPKALHNWALALVQQAELASVSSTKVWRYEQALSKIVKALNQRPDDLGSLTLRGHILYGWGMAARNPARLRMAVDQYRVVLDRGSTSTRVQACYQTASQMINAAY